MKYSTKLLSQSLVHLCEIKEIYHIVISPGSRNAPLTIGFTENPEFHCYSIVDERCAAFFALGIAQQIKKPVVLVCTSGSALLNYYPAIAEAFYSDIPLVIASADRPKEFINIGDGQTIMQENVFENHIEYSFNCKEGDHHIKTNEIGINTAINIAIEQSGPVHINIPFSEPLYNTTTKLEVNSKNILPSYKNELSLEEPSVSKLLDLWNSSSRKMILVGVLTPNLIDKEILELLAKDASLVVLTETTSNLYHQNFFPSIDQLIAPLDDEDFKKLQPELLVTFGGMIVSKKVKAFLRNYPPKYHVHIDKKKANNTFFSLTHSVKDNPNPVLHKIVNNAQLQESNYRDSWLKIKEKRINKHQEYIESIGFSDFKVFSEIIKSIPKNIQLQISNSAAIRYMQLFSFSSDTEMYCNRGTSGIDGSTSTAIGAATITSKPVVFITGDLSFFYDSNALWNNYIPKNFKIIVLNNKGGGIFRILPGNKNTENFDTYFETKHSLNASSLAEMYCLNYFSVSEESELMSTLKLFFSESNQASILEIFTPSIVNDQVLLDYFKFIK